MSRDGSRSRGLRRRPGRVVPATLVALVLLAVGGLTAYAAVSRLVQDSWPAPVTQAAPAVASLTWGATATVVAGSVAAVVGLVLLLAALVPGAFSTVRLRPDAGADPGFATDFVISTRAVAKLAAASADSVDGVDKVAVSASARRVTVRADTTSEQAGEISRRIREGVSQTLSAAGVQPVPRVVATVRTRGI